MNLDKAIESNQDLIAQPWLQPFPDFVESVKLGNEALKRVQSIRGLWSEDHVRKLPGETKE